MKKSGFHQKDEDTYEVVFLAGIPCVYQLVVENTSRHGIILRFNDLKSIGYDFFVFRTQE